MVSKLISLPEVGKSLCGSIAIASMVSSRNKYSVLASPPSTNITKASPKLTRLPNAFFINDRAGKPTGINLFIGKRPLAAFGNSEGDRQMLEFSKTDTNIATNTDEGARLAVLFLHEDPTGEYAYGPAQGLPHTSFGPFTQPLYDQAKKEGWVVFSMKNDWKQIFSVHLFIYVHSVEPVPKDRHPLHFRLEVTGSPNLKQSTRSCPALYRWQAIWANRCPHDNAFSLGTHQ